MIADSNSSENRLFINSDESSAHRVGARIRAIREENGISQAELGERVGLNADRIQKYENGARKPKADLLNSIATALNVSVYALQEPVLTNEIGAMYALFEMDDIYGLKVSNNYLSVSFVFDAVPSDILKHYLKEWSLMEEYYSIQISHAQTEEEKRQLLHEYKMWKWNFPKDVDEQNKEYVRQEKRKKLQEMIQHLQQELSEL